MHYFLTIAFLFFLHFIHHTQNLVPNSSFENLKRCPGNEGLFGIYSNMVDCKEWYNPTKASPDYYNKCSETTAFGVPKNWLGTQAASSGFAYSGIGYFLKDKHSEYIAVELNNTIEEGKIYCIKMFVSVPDKANLSTTGLDVTLTRHAINDRGKTIVHPEKFISLTKNHIIRNKDEWVELCGIIEGIDYHQCRHLTIGWFRDSIPQEQIVKKFINHNLFEIYFYVDDVELIEITDPASCKCDMLEQKESIITEIASFNSAITKPIILKNVFFAIDESELLPTSYKELDSLFSYLISNDSIRVEISGHTDNSGKEDRNVKLSYQRASAVAQYIIGKGIEKRRISVKGFGSSKPIKPNNSEENKAINRRVEFRVITK